MQRTEASQEFAASIRRYRIAAGFTQEALAERADVGTRSIQGMETGERRPYRATLQRLTGALGLSPEQSRRLEALARPPRAGVPRTPARPAPGRREIAPDGCSSLPRPLTGFVGRGREMAEVRRLLGTSRLVSLTGPPGVGKTRLAQEVAADIADTFADGARFLPLAAITEPDLVASTIARVARVEGTGGQPLVDRLVAALRDRQLLLVLDNFEQVVAAAPLVARLLEGCPRLAVLVTSRTRLRVRGEREFVVPPLALPDLPELDARSDEPAPAAVQSEAVRLFLDRAREAGADLVVDRGNPRAIATICRRLDGLPLAIELAAARCKLLSPPALLARLGDRFALLTTGPRDLPPRQQTLRAAIAWSHDLLTDDERALFRRLAVFVDGFSLRATEAVCGGTLGDLTSLVDASLVQPGPGDDGEPRFRMLETIGEFARGQLAASGEEAPLRDRHAAFFLALAERSDPGDRPPDVGRLTGLADDHGNLRAALRFLIDRGDGEGAARLASALDDFWKTRGFVDEARGSLGAILGLLGDADRTPTRARLLLQAARPAFRHSDNALARRRVEESLALYRALGDRRGVAAALHLAGLIARWQGQYDLAWRHFEEERAIRRELGDRYWIAESDDVLGVVAFWMGDGARGRALLESALAEFRRQGNRMAVGFVLHNLGFVAHGLGDHSASLACYEERLAIAREVGFRMGIGEALGGLGDLELDRGDLDAARARLTEGLRIHRDLGNRREIAHVLECVAGLAALRDQPERAVRLGAAAAALREAIAEPVPPDQAIRMERRLGGVRRIVGEDTFARAGAEGRAMMPEQAIADALDEGSD